MTPNSPSHLLARRATRKKAARLSVLALLAASPGFSQLSELSPPLTPAQVACDQAQLEKLEARMASRPFQGNLVLWRSGRGDGEYAGLATTRGLFPGASQPRTRDEKQIAFQLSIDAEGDFLNPRRALLPQATLARRSAATNLVQEPDADLVVTLDLSPTVLNQILPRQPLRLDNRLGGSAEADGAGRGLAAEGLATACHGAFSDFDLTMFEILSRTLRASRCLAPPTFCTPSDEFIMNLTLFRGEAPGTYRANVYVVAQECDVAPCETSFVIARPEVEITVEVDAAGRLARGGARFLPFCQGPRPDCTDDGGTGPWAVFVLPPIWAGHEVQGGAEFAKGGFLNVLGESSSANVLTTAFDWSVLLAGTAWSRPFR